MLRHIIFDCDGVLWHGTNEGYFLCYHRAALEAGIEMEFGLARERILQNWGQSARIEVEGMIPEFPDRIDEVAANYRRLVRSDLFLQTAAEVPGVHGCLAALARDHALSVITGMNGDNLPRLLGRFGMRDYFRHAISTADTEDPDKQKPTGYHLRRLLQFEGLDPQDVLCVGDATSDILMARSQSAPIVIVLTGHLTEAEARDHGIADILPSVAELPAWVQRRR